MCRKTLCVILSLSIVIGGLPGSASVVRAGELFRRTFGRKTNVEKLAHELDCLEKKIGLYGTIVAKGPDVWGQARLTRHRDEFEQQMAKQLDKLSFSLNGELARTDQAYLIQALSLSAALTAAKNPSTGGSGTTTNVATSSAAAADTVSSILDKATDGSIVRSKPTDLLTTGFGGADGNPATYLAVEPQVLLDQRARYLNHLHQLRRINDGDDISDAPGYSLNLVRIPVSILSGDRTREGYGAEITVTATPYLTDDLLPTTFRALVINDLVDLLALPITQIVDHYYSELLALEREVVRLSAKDLTSGMATSGETLRTSRTNKSDPIKEPTVGDYIKCVRQNKMDYVKLGLPEQDALPIKGSRAAATRARRSRYALSPSQVVPVFGKEELEQIALRAFECRDQYACSTDPNRLQLSEVQAFLRAELEVAFDSMKHGSISCGGWDWVQGQNARQLVERIRGTDSTDLEQLRSCFHMKAAIVARLGRTNSAMAKKPTKPTPKQTVVQQVSYDEEDGETQLPRAKAVVARRSLAVPDLAATALLSSTHEGTTTGCPTPTPSITEALAWAIVVESVLLNEHLKEDMLRVSQDPECACHPGVDADLAFYLPDPGPTERQLFIDYVRCRWPIHVFALDPVTQQQNIADTYALRRETQIALAVAFTGRNINGRSLTRYMRRIEEDMKTIELNNTVVGFGHGTDTFGWRFFPRFQSPPLESNLTVLGRDLLWGGPSRNDRLRQQRIEQGMRECTAIVIMPSFVRHVTFETRSNWFSLANCKHGCRSDSGAKLIDTVAWSRDIRCMEQLAECAFEESDMYRPGEVDRLRNRAEQLSRRLPLQTLHSQVPYENTLGGFEMFSSGVTDLAPELLGYYGAPGIDPSQSTELFLVGNHFSVHDTQVIAGNIKCETNLLSRQVMRVTIPSGVRVEKRREQPNGRSALAASPGNLPSETPQPCPMPDDPCCSRRFVEIRLATPYGIAGQLHVPVVGDPEASPDLEWSVKNYPMVYNWSQSGTSPFTVGDQDIRVKPPFRFAIKVPANVVVASTKVTIEMALIGDAAGISTLPPLTDIPFNVRSGAYVIEAAQFATLQKNIKDTVVKTLGGSTPPNDYIVELQATVKVGDVNLGVSDSLTIPIHFEKRQ